MFSDLHLLLFFNFQLSNLNCQLIQRTIFGGPRFLLFSDLWLRLNEEPLPPTLVAVEAQVTPIFFAPYIS
jgi:hypothetical protein